MINIIENNPILIFITLLILFILMGTAGIGFALINPNPLPLMGWLVLGGFIVIPSLIIYRLTFKANTPKKQTPAIKDRRKNLVFDEYGISLVMPVQAATWFIAWDSIDTITYTNFSTDDQAHYSIDLNKVPEYFAHENPWWLAKLFPMKPKRKWVRISGDAKHFSQLPNAVQQYVGLLEHGQHIQNDHQRSYFLIELNRARANRS